MSQQYAVPSLYDRSDNFAGPYAPRTAAFGDEGRRAGLRPASQDKRRVAKVFVDDQHDFVDPSGTLSVPGSQDDICRSVEWLYRNAEEVSTIIVSLDSHLPYQIFYGAWWQYEDGTHPDPFTMIMLNGAGETVDHNGRRVMPLLDPRWSLDYVRSLKQNANKDLMIWPEHTMLGTLGHSLVPSLSEAIAFHSAARLAQPIFLQKGMVPQVEHYGIFAPEVMYSKNPMGGLNTAMLDLIATHDLIYVSGEAKSHCVLATMGQLVGYFSQKQPDVLRKIRFLSDCTSSVVHPAVDFDALAEAELREMAKKGVQLVTSADPIA